MHCEAARSAGFVPAVFNNQSQVIIEVIIVPFFPGTIIEKRGVDIKYALLFEIAAGSGRLVADG